jgi:hypothetical protein
VQQSEWEVADYYIYSDPSSYLMFPLSFGTLDLDLDVPPNLPEDCRELGISNGKCLTRNDVVFVEKLICSWALRHFCYTLLLIKLKEHPECIPAITSSLIYPGTICSTSLSRSGYWPSTGSRVLPLSPYQNDRALIALSKFAFYGAMSS